MSIFDAIHKNQNTEYLRGKRNGTIEVLAWSVAITVIISFLTPYLTHKPIADLKTTLSNFGFVYFIYGIAMPIIYHLVNKLLQKKY